MMPLSPLSPPVPKVFVANPLDQITPVTEAMLRNPAAATGCSGAAPTTIRASVPCGQITKRNVDEMRVSLGLDAADGSQ